MLKKLKQALKRNRKLYLAISPVFGLYRNAVMGCARIFKGYDGRLAVFSAFDSRSYNDNPRYISEALHEICPEAKIVWLFRDVQKAKRDYDIPDYITCLNAISREGVSALARARIVVDNFNKRSYIRLKYPQQVYIQTWHGDRAFKKVGYDNPGQYKYLIEEHATLCISGSDYGDRQFRSAFRYKGEIMKVGYPRNDILLRNDPSGAETIRERLGISSETKLLMYAPTFRDVEQRAHRPQQARFDLLHVLDTLERSTGEKWQCLVRAHYMSYGIPTDDASGRLVNVSSYPEMAELLKISDALITDYSSCAGDFALTRRPIWLYQDDIEDYKNNNRALYFDMAESPYWVASTPEEMDALIRNTTPESAKENCEAILRFYGEAETGHAARSVAEYIVSKMENVKP
ncbi:MAG: CDP-glycerol glycerophosphotransferase family protein [Clostridia bacterium]|nr:CDP-glycerol glycerophosphotransferase family protein [Clostridia bacterium]